MKQRHEYELKNGAADHVLISVGRTADGIAIFFGRYDWAGLIFADFHSLNLGVSRISVES